MSEDRVLLFADDFSAYPLGPVENGYTPWGEYHCRTDQGRLGPWAEATTHHSWRQSNGCWRVAQDGSRRVLEQTFCAKHSYPLIVTGDEHWRDYQLEAEVRPLSLAAPCGLVFGYRHSRDYFALLLDGAAPRLIKRTHDHTEELASAPLIPDVSEYVSLSVACGPEGIVGRCGDITLVVLGNCDHGHGVSRRVRRGPVQGISQASWGHVALRSRRAVTPHDHAPRVPQHNPLETPAPEFPGGLIGLIANAPARFANIRVSASREEEEAAAHRGAGHTAELNRLRQQRPRPVLWRKVDISRFGTDRNLRVGDLDGDGENEIVLAQHRPYLGGDGCCMISSLAALRLNGEVLWHVGDPAPQSGDTTADLCFQVHDIDGDGCAEVLYTSELELRIADGATGETRLSVPTPDTAPPAAQGGYPMARVVGDCLYFCDLDGSGRRDSIILKDRYTQCWAYDADLGPRWTHRCNTGHYPTSYDLNGDGREEIMMGYSLLSADGELLWELDAIDHADSLVIGPLRDGGPVRLAVSGSDAGFYLLDAEGDILRHHAIGHAQTICVAKLRPDVDGLQIVVNTYWGEPGITLVLDADGNLLDEFEPVHYACLLQPANWGPDGSDLILLSTHPLEGGMIDGRGRRVVMFPDDGHPVLCSDVRDIDGDGVDEVLTWDRNALWIYKADPGSDCRSGPYPERNPWCNDSNYRGQYSFPR